MGSTAVYLLILMQHVVPELGLAEVIVATGKPATPPSGYSPQWLNAYNNNNNNNIM